MSPLIKLPEIELRSPYFNIGDRVEQEGDSNTYTITSRIAIVKYESDGGDFSLKYRYEYRVKDETGYSEILAEHNLVKVMD